jgi:acyl-CoA synthetase (AMP-forming)/AMP-acid ligase II
MTPLPHLTGRAKDTIVLSNGENVEPQPIEDAICAQSDLVCGPWSSPFFPEEYLTHAVLPLVGGHRWTR